MPIDPQQLIALARDLVNVPAGARTEANLRRAVSTAYYAVFHLLINDAMAIFLTDPIFRTRVGRAFQHGIMKTVSSQYSPQNPNSAGQFLTPTVQILAPDVRRVASAFFALNEAREEADYDGAINVQHIDAESNVQRAETAFQDWLTAQADPSALEFLQDLFCKSIIRR
jgi:uncharacterized protein (UPF0332 family)